MRVGAAGANLGGDPDRFHDLLRACSFALSEAGVALNAVRALRDVGGCHGDQLLGLLRQRPFGEDGVAEVVEGLVDGGGKLFTASGDLPCGGW